MTRSVSPGRAGIPNLLFSVRLTRFCCGNTWQPSGRGWNLVGACAVVSEENTFSST